MTDNEKMREEFENCSLHDGYSDDRRLEENKEWFTAGWQAAQSVPVVGEPVGYVSGAIHQLGNTFASVAVKKSMSTYVDIPLYLAPTTSITAQELDALRKNAERPDCGTCANRGRVDGLSQESFCEHCSWSEKWRKNHYKPITTQESQP